MVNGKSQLESEGFSLRAAVAGGFTYMAESHFRHLCTCESAFVCVWRETGSERREEQERGRGSSMETAAATQNQVC